MAPLSRRGESGFIQKPQPRWARPLRRILLFRVTAEPVDPNAPVTATYTITFPGAASADDLAAGTVLTGTVTIPAGAASATIAIATFDDVLSCKGESHGESGQKWMHQQAFRP